jgi:Fe2+ transport system protein FeoA
MPIDHSQALTHANHHLWVTIQRVSAASPDLLRHFQSLGLVPGERVRVIDFSPLDQIFLLEIGTSAPTVVGAAIVSQIFVIAS